MREAVRFHLDEHIDPAVARALRRCGINTTTTNEVGLRTFVTHDHDFLRLSRAAGDHPGIVYCMPTRSVGELGL